jgi:hypothetical protein
VPDHSEHRLVEVTCANLGFWPAALFLLLSDSRRSVRLAKLAHHFSGEPVCASRCRCGAFEVQCNSRCLNPFETWIRIFTGFRFGGPHVTSELSTRSAFVLSNGTGEPDARFSSAHQPETDRLSSPYQLEEPSSPTYPLLTPRVALQAPPADSISAGSSSCFLDLSCERGKQAVLTCKTRDAFPRLGEELGIDTPRRLSSCTANETALSSNSVSNRACSSG